MTTSTARSELSEGSGRVGGRRDRGKRGLRTILAVTAVPERVPDQGTRMRFLAPTGDRSPQWGHGRRVPNQQSVCQSGLIIADGPDVGGEADAGISLRPSSRRTDPPFGRRQLPLLCDRPPQRLHERTGGAGKCAQEARIHEAAGSGVEDTVGAEIAFAIGRLMQI